MKLYVGTSGYSYKEWKGIFYPEMLPAKQMLNFYGTRLNAVETNSTFRRAPEESVLKSWAAQVPYDFRFSIKASQEITHFKRLKDVQDEVGHFFRTVRVLKERFGVMLFQLPPNFKKDVPRLQVFFKEVPKKVRVAFEFRHESWFDEETFDCLREHNSSLCIADADDELKVPFVSTADWGYLRLRRVNYTPSQLKSWYKRVAEQQWGDAFVFFKHEDAATGPKLAEKFLKLGIA